MAPTNTLTGTTGNDILNAPGSVDTLVQGLPGNDTITLIRSGDVADAADGNDIIKQSANGTLANTISGGLGNDTISFTGVAALFSGSVSAASGNDLISFDTTTFNAAFVGAGVGKDTIVLTSQLISSTIQGGEDADLLTLSGVGNMVASYIGAGKGADTINVGAVANTTSSVAGGEGADLINAASANNNLNFVAGGAGTDTLNLANAAFGTVVGGGLADTISFNGGVVSGVVYGDALGVEAEGTGTDGTADGADFIGSGVNVASGFTVFGAGGNDTINFGTTTTAGTYFNGGADADRLTLAASTGSITIEGGGGADTITAGNITSAGFIGGGAGADSILLGTIVTGVSVNGGSGVDTITFAAADGGIIDGGSENDRIGSTAAIFDTGTLTGGDGNDTITLLGSSGATILGGAGSDSIILRTAATDPAVVGVLSTINGGDGSDTIALQALGTAIGIDDATAGNVNSAYNANVVYGSGDVISLDYGATTSANWIGTAATIQVLTAASGAFGATAVGAGSVAVFADSTQTLIFASSSVGTVYYAVRIQGKDLVTATSTGAVTFNSTNFGFALSNSNGNGLNITLA